MAALLFLMPAVEAAPAWKADLTPPAAAPFAKLAPCKLDYQASWKGLISAGAIHLEFGNPGISKPGSYVVTATGTSMGPASALYNFKCWYWSELDPATYAPKLFNSVEDTGKRHITDQLDYDGKGVTINRTVHINANGFEYKNKKTFAFSPLHDLFSSMLFVRSQKLDNGDKLSFVIQPGDTAYLVKVNVESREPHNGRASIRLGIVMFGIDPATLELEPYKKMKNSTMWISDDTDRIPLEVRAGVFIGDVRVTLTGQGKL